MESTQIAIIGGGFSGVSTALHWLRFHGVNQQVTLFETRDQIGEGVAYQTQSLQHLLNVPAERMGLFYDDPKGFLFWLQERGFIQFQAHDFVPRLLFAEYLKDYLEYFKTRYSNFQTSQDEIIAIRKNSGGYLLETKSGRQIAAQVVIGAWGQTAKQAKLDVDVPQIKNIWDRSMNKKFAPGTQFAILGSGLSMIDFVMDIHAESPTAEFWCLSRHGYLPQPHLPRGLAAQPLEIRWQGSPRKILRQAHQWMRANPDCQWTQVADNLRSNAPAIWKSWSLRQKGQFLRHLKPSWEPIRHRVPGDVNQQIQELKSKGQLEVHAGNLEAVFHNEILWRPRHEERLREKKFDYLVPLMGAETNITQSPWALQKQLFNEGLVVPDAHRLGVQTDMRGRPVDSNGDVLRNFYLIGAQLRPLYWESTAVPEIRQQIFNLVQSLTETPKIQVDSLL